MLSLRPLCPFSVALFRPLTLVLPGQRKNDRMMPLKGLLVRDAQPAQSVERATLDLGVVGLSPTLGIELTFKKRLMGTWVA